MSKKVALYLKKFVWFLYRTTASSLNEGAFLYNGQRFIHNDFNLYLKGRKEIIYFYTKFQKYKAVIGKKFSSAAIDNIFQKKI